MKRPDLADLAYNSDIVLLHAGGTHAITRGLSLATDHRPAVVNAPARTIIDISGVARWTGPAVGILRVEEALARYALARRPDIVLAFYDNASASFCAVNSRWAAHIVGWSGAVGRRHPGPRRRLLSLYSVVDLLERWRLASGGGAIARGIGLLQRVILRARRRGRRRIVPFRIAIGPPLVLGTGDVILSVGSDWIQKDAARIAVLKKTFGFRYVVMCHDIIPLLLPQYFLAEDVAAFRRYWTEAFSLADRILVNSRRVASDVASYCERNAIPSAECRLVPLGCDLPSVTAPVPLPDSLEPGRFILFVSTIEPRKGHSMLLRVWDRLLAANVPQRQRWKLVFVGRPGWQIDDVLDQLDDRALFAGTVMHLAGVDDETLGSLYHAAAFCVYPSQYEGLGLPIIEAFSRGKAVIASTGGALPETVGGFSPCLDPNDTEAWYETLKTWIERPDIREKYETRIRSDFS